MSGALAAAWLSAALLAGDPVDAPAAGRQVSRVLEQERYLFCREDNNYYPQSNDMRFCGLASAVAQRCPGYAQVCDRGLELYFDDDASLHGDSSGYDVEHGDGEGEKQPGKANEGAYREVEPFDFTLPDLGGLAQVLMWILIIGGALALAVVIAKNLIRGRDEDDEPEHETELGADDSLIAARAAAMRAVETDVQRLLARGEQAAGRGDFQAAINDVYAALLRKLEGAQLIAVEHWKTNGDYLGELRSRPPLRDEVREIVRDVEQVQFGSAPAEQGRYVGIRNKVLSLVGRAVLAFAVLVCGATMLGCPLFEEKDGIPNSARLAGLGTGPGGARAVGELLLIHEIEASHRTRSIEQLARSDKAIILLHDVELLDEDWDTLIRWVEEDGGALFIATGREFPREIGIDYAMFESDATELTPGVEYFYFSQLQLQAPIGRVLDLGPGALGRSEELLVRPSPPTSTDADAWSYEPVEQLRPYVVRRSLGAGEIVVFAEPDLLTNVGISVADNGAFLVNLLRSRDITEVEFVDQYTGAGPDDPFESMGNAKLGGLFLQILLFLALLYAAVGIPFARLRDPERQARRSFVEHVRTLGQRYAQARASRYVAGLYSAWALDRLRERLLLGTARGLHPLAQAIASRTGRDEAAVMQLLVQAHELRENSQNSTRGSAGDLELMRQLAKLLDEISRR